MIILIDGYNVLRAIKPGPSVGAHERDQFIAQLARYAKRKGHTLIVVFDGGLSTMRETQRKGDVRVMYVGRGHIADDYIKEYLDEHPGSHLLVVSNDRELIDHARKYDMPHIGAMTFYSFVQQSGAAPKAVQKRQRKARKMTSENSQELDALMESAQVPSEAEPTERSVRVRSAQKVSKKQKRLNEIFKKL